MSFEEGSLMRRRTVAIAAIAAVSTAVVSVSVAVAVGAEVPVNGAVMWCLSPAAAKQLETIGVTMSAAAPATLDSSGATPCVRLPMKGKISLDASSGNGTFDGSISFTQSADGRSLRLTQASGDLTARKVYADVGVDDEPSRTVNLTTYTLDMRNITVIPPSLSSAGAVEGKPFDTLLTDSGAVAFARAFGAPPVPSGDSLATIEGRVDVASVLG